MPTLPSMNGLMRGVSLKLPGGEGAFTGRGGSRMQRGRGILSSINTGLKSTGIINKGLGYVPVIGGVLSAIAKAFGYGKGRGRGTRSRLRPTISDRRKRGGHFIPRPKVS